MPHRDTELDMHNSVQNEDGDNEADEADENEVCIEFLHGPRDSFNYTAPLPASSISPPSAQNEFQSPPVHHADFISLVTAVSRAYRRDGYLEMRKLDDVIWSRFENEQGSVFHVSRSNLAFKVVSPINANKIERIVNKVVIKRVNDWYMSEKNVASLTREVRILDHLRGTSNIVGFRGVGWFYHGDTVRHIPEPVLMLEEAQHSLRYLVSPRIHLPTSTMLRIFYDIVKGLSALHRCGIVHGDIKIDNVLLFRADRREEGVIAHDHIAKLSDFSLSVLDNGGRQYLPGGSHLYVAPESGDYLTFAQLKQTDVYSLGMLFAVVAAQTEDLFSLGVMRRLRSDSYIPDIHFTQEIIRGAAIQAESSTFTQDRSELFVGLFKNTLRQDPSHRNLDDLLRRFDVEYEQRTVHQVTEILRDSAPADVQVSYAAFSVLSGHIKDLVTQGLMKIYSAGEADPRYPKACFELAVTYISKYNNPTASVLEGLKYLWASAESGDPRAQALYGRLQSAHDCVEHPGYRDRRLGWLHSAASKGYRTAQEDLAALDPEMAHEAMKEYATLQIEQLFKRQAVSVAFEDPDVAPELHVHLSAATGCIDMLMSLLDEHPHLVNKQNMAGDTPFLGACRFGQFETARTLLSRMAVDPSITNRWGENPLHFLWQFTNSQADILFGGLIQRGADPDQQALPSQSGARMGWDMIPHMTGTPVERVASLGRLDLVRLFIDRGCAGIVPCNGRKLRRMLLLAIRLQHTELQEFLVQYASSGPRQVLQPLPGAVYRIGTNELLPLCETTWEYKSRRRSYLDAAVLGWVRNPGSGAWAAVDVPFAFWQTCYHGPKWRTAMTQTIRNALPLSHRPHSRREDQSLDVALNFSIHEGSHSVFEQLMYEKILRTDAQGPERLRDLRCFCWTRDANIILGLPVLPVNYIDQIFYNYSSPTAGTLAQAAMRLGDRVLFHILVHRFGANLTLPFYGSRAHEQQQNCYSALARSTHQDMWFTHEFYDLNIGFNCPYEVLPSTGTRKWAHPLLDAICAKSWALARWLISHGASVLDPVVNEDTVLDRVLALDPLPGDLIDFLIPLDDPERSFTWWAPARLSVQRGGYFVFYIAFKAIDTMQRNAKNRKDNDVLATIWLSLLEEYPAVVNYEPPAHKYPSVICMTRELFERHFSRAQQNLSFNILIVPTIRVRVDLSLPHNGFRISLLSVKAHSRRITLQSAYPLARSFIQGSPLDDIPLPESLARHFWLHGYLPSIRHPTISGFLTALRFLLPFGGFIALAIWLFVMWLNSLTPGVGILILRFFSQVTPSIFWTALRIAIVALIILVVGCLTQGLIILLLGESRLLDGIFVNPEVWEAGYFSGR